MPSPHPDRTPATGPLSPEEAARLADGITALAAAGLPLPEGLRALGAESRSGRLRRALDDLAGRLERGEDLAEVLAAEKGPLPAHLRGLVIAGLASGRLAELLAEYGRLERTERDYRRRLRGATVYPLILLVLGGLITVGVGVWGMEFLAMVTEEFRLEPAFTTRAIQVLFWPLVVAVAATVALLISPLILAGLFPNVATFQRAAAGLPLVGRLRRDQGLLRWLSLAGVLVRGRVPLPEALRLAGGAANEVRLTETAGRLAAGLEAGRPLRDCMAAEDALPALLQPPLTWAADRGEVDAGFAAAADIFQQRVDSQLTLITAMLPVMAFLAVALLVGTALLVISEVLILLISLITELSG